MLSISAFAEQILNMFSYKKSEHEINNTEVEEKATKEEENSERLTVEERLGTKYKWKRRIPASRFGNVVRAKGKREDEQFTDEILSFKFSGDTEATLYGKEHEKDALKQLEEYLGVTIEEPKKIVDKEHKFLVCIPDGLIGTDQLVEIKCPYKCLRNSMESLAENDAEFCLGLTPTGELRLKRDHNYFYQVQGELNMSQRETCYFVVWSPEQFHCEIVHRDGQFWEREMFPWLLEFYRVHILDGKWSVPDIPEEEAKVIADDVLSRLRTSKTKQQEIEVVTRGQGDNPLWLEMRKYRLTASNFGRVVKMRPTTSCHNTVVSILYPDSLDRIEAIRYGKDHESDAIEALNTILARNGLKVEECGLFIDTITGYLAATPDGTVGEDGLVEVKCPMKCKDSSIAELVRTDSTFCLENSGDNMRLKRSHNYYYQIQGQLHMAKRSKCYFFIWSPTEHHLETINYDPEFWAEVQETLAEFYMNCLLPEIADPRAPRGLPVREPDYIIQAQQSKDLIK